jgi:dihydroorotate dehydrogenase (NAD+) catalytic subunit
MSYNFFSETVVGCHELKRGLDSGIFILALTWHQDRKPLPGQFVVFKPITGVMPRPFSVTRYEDGQVFFVIKVLGENSKAYTSLNIGDQVEISEPKGMPFVFPIGYDGVILVGGGIGFAAVYALRYKLMEEGKKAVCLLGAKDESQLLPELFSLSIPTVETIVDKQGLVTDLLAKKLKSDGGKSLVVACGPIPMLSKVAEMCAVSGNPCQVIMEEIMACGGTGACKGCAIFGKDGSVKHVCQDGPAFDAAWIDWSRFEKRITISSFPTSEPRANPLEVRLNTLVLSSPLMPASGCFDFNSNGQSADISHAGALVAKGIKINPVAGNEGPRVCEVPGGMLNSIGLEGVGITRFIDEVLPLWLELGIPVFVNICGGTIEEYFELADRLADTAIAGVEINISCPNVQEGCIAFGVDPLMTMRVTKGVRERLPGKILVSVKHTPRACGNIVAVAKAARDGGADVNCLGNTFSACAFDIWTRKFKLGAGPGGYSGPGILPMAVELVRQVAAADLGIPIIGCGGVTDPESATQMILAGASAVQIGTGLFAQPDLMTRICDFWKEKYLPFQKVNSIQDMIGKGGK